MSFRNSLSALCLALVMLCPALFPPALVRAQGFLLDDREGEHHRLPRPIIIVPPPRPPHPVPPPHDTYKIKELAVNATLQDQVAKVQVTQSFVNTGSRQMEVSFVFPLPYDGAVDRMTFLVDGKEYDAKLLTAQEARRIYEEYVRRNQDPALMEWLGTGMFKTSVFPVPPGAERTVTLRYSQVCRKRDGLTELVFPLSTAKYTSHPVEKVSVRIALQSEAKIKNIYSPSHPVDISRSSDRNAVVSFTRTNEVPTSDMVLMYDVGNAEVGASLLSYRPKKDDEGYFLLLVSPDIKSPEKESIKKTVMFVVDRSGSMSGKKIDQAKGALRFVLNNLNEGDLFNIVAYDSAVESFRPELQRFTKETRDAALGFVEGIYAGGSTNIDGALQTALSQLNDEKRATYIVFLTDGLPTTGERNPAKIIDSARSRNRVRARIFSFGVGYDVNSRLLDQLSRVCRGESEYVRPDEDIESQVSKLYSRIGAPVLTDLKIGVDMEAFPKERGSVISRVYPRDAYDLFAGDQLVVVGRYKEGGDAKVTIEGKVGEQQQKFDFAGKFAAQSGDETNAFVEKLWAVRRVGEIIDEIDLHGKNNELVEELVKLSTQHGIITPYTSFLADENANVRDMARSERAAGAALDALSMEGGYGGFAQRDYKAQLQRAAQPAAPGMGGGFSLEAAPAGRAGAGAPADSGFVVREEREKSPRAQTVQQVGSKTFFLREGRWFDSALTEEQEKHVRNIERYSPEYFELANRHGKDAARYMAIEGPVTVVLDGQAYAF
jgi:Ca-activated chloride channel family protein